MGLLDDAIREHLELKKAHGASAEEVDHLAQEALGPARREAEANGDEAVAKEPVAGVASSEPVDVSPAEADPEPEPEAEPVIPSAEELADATEEHESPARAWELSDEELEGEEPEPGAEEEELEGEDVLEETPEFLQETPEHDRLWFEQKPPRDFDFDR